MKPADFAELMQVSRQAVGKACTSKRLSRAVTRDARGRVVAIDPEIGREEWLASKSPQHTGARMARARVEDAARRDAARARADLSPADLEGVTKLLSEVVERDCDETKRAVLDFIPHVMQGAIEGLRSAGREPTRAALVKAFGLDGGPDNATMISGALLDLVEAGRPDEDEVARRLGRDEATGKPYPQPPEQIPAPPGEDHQEGER